MLRRLILLSAIVLQASLAQACSVPVFRYALEHWRPDPFPVVIFYEGELTPEQKALVDRLEPVVDGATEKLPNAWVELIDVTSTEIDPQMLELWEAQETKSLPWMTVLSPSKFGMPQQVVSAELSTEIVDRLLESPARAEITKRLIAGHSSVWVLLEGGNKDEDEAAFETLTAELKRLQGELKLPEIDPQDIADGSLSVEPEELKLKFSVVRVSRDDPKESAFVEMLLNTEPDLRDSEFDGQAMALPVFGRGRMLYALIGKGINAEVITDTCTFLTGACQCTVKAQSPGVDMLTSVDWDRHITPRFQKDTELPPLTGLAGFGETEEPAETESAETESDVPQTAAVVEQPTEVATASVTGSAAVKSDQKTKSFNMSRLALFFVGGLAVVAAGLSIVFAPRER